MLALFAGAAIAEWKKEAA